MTQEEARQLLGITGSISRSKTALVYEEKCKKLRLHMVPGMPEVTRHKAYSELARLSTAWLTLQAAPAFRHRSKKKVHCKSPTRRHTPTNRSQKPQTLADAWAAVVFQMPFSETVVVIISIAIALLILILLMKVL